MEHSVLSVLCDVNYNLNFQLNVLEPRRKSTEGKATIVGPVGYAAFPREREREKKKKKKKEEEKKKRNEKEKRKKRRKKEREVLFYVFLLTVPAVTLRQELHRYKNKIY